MAGNTQFTSIRTPRYRRTSFRAIALARAHFTRGNHLYRSGHIEDALAAYLAGAALDPTPVFDYNLGQCYRKLGRRADAARHYERFLERGRPEGALRELVIGFVRQLREELAREAPPLGERVPPPARSLPAPSASSPPLAALASAPAAPSQPPARSASAPAALELTRVPTAPARRPRWYADRLGWGLLTGGAAAAAGALYLRDQAADLAAAASPSMPEARRRELGDAARARGLASAALGAVSVALVAGGVASLGLSGRGSHWCSPLL